MDKTHTAEAIADKLIAAGKAKIENRALIIEIWELMADSLIDEIKNYSTITITGQADEHGNVTGSGSIL